MFTTYSLSSSFISDSEALDQEEVGNEEEYLSHSEESIRSDTGSGGESGNEDYSENSFQSEIQSEAEEDEQEQDYDDYEKDDGWEEGEAEQQEEEEEIEKNRHQNGHTKRFSRDTKARSDVRGGSSKKQNSFSIEASLEDDYLRSFINSIKEHG